MNIVHFIRARLADDAKAPQADVRDPSGADVPDPPWPTFTVVGGRYHDDLGNDITDALWRWREALPLSEEAVRWCDEITAKRLLLEHRLTFLGHYEGDDLEDDGARLRKDHVLRLLAYPYRRHVDYEQEWIL